MVEKIIVSPESIRALGNIVVPKTGADFEEYNCTMEVSEDTVNGEDVTVYVLTPETTVISLVLSSNVSTVTAGSNVILSVTVTEDEVPVSGQSVSFKLGSTELGTSTTNSSGVATYTYTTTGSGSLNFSADYAGHSSNAVSVVVNKRSTSTSLSLSSANIIVSGSTTASATVTSTGSGVSGLTVTFYDGTTSLGTATTNSSGVATYTLSGLAVGSHSITAVVTATDVYDTSTSSASTLTVLDHSYSLTFSQASYVATGGSAILECTLLDNNVPVEGATISMSGSDSSLYTGLTDSRGVATVTVSNVSVLTTFTASYSNVSAQCTVTVPSYLFYDDCSSSSRLSEYGSAVQLFNTTGAVSLTYNSTENAYSLTKTSNADKFGGYKIPITTLDGIRVTFKAKVQSTSAYSQFGIGIQQSTSKFEMIRIRGDKYLDGFKNNTNTGIISQSNVAAFSGDYYTVTIDYSGSNRTINIYNSSDSLIKTWTGTIQTYTNASMYIACNTNSNGAYIKEIKVESL